MKRRTIYGTIAIGFSLGVSTAWAQDTSTQVFNAYTHSALNPESFDAVVASARFDERFHACLQELHAKYGPIAEEHLNACRRRPPEQRQACIQQAPPAVHVGDWVASMILKLNGASWCDTSSGMSACLGKEMLGPAAWERNVTPYFPRWREALTCKPQS